MEGTGLDNEFVSTRYGVLRVAHFALCIICLILEEVSSCYTRDHRLFEWVSSYGLIFSILVLVMFCVRFNLAIENFVNLPLSLMVNEVILCVLFVLAGVSVLMSLCAGAAKIGGIFTGIFGIITGVTFGAAARLSYDWFATGSPATTM